MSLNVPKFVMAMCVCGMTLCLSIVVPLWGATPADTLAIFSDRANFLSATGASATAAPPLTNPPTSSPLIVGDLTFSVPPDGSAILVAENIGTNPGLELSVIFGNNLTELNIDLAKPAIAFGFDFIDADFGDTFDSAFSVDLFLGGTPVGSFV